MDCSMPDFPVLHYLPESVRTRVHWVSDAIQSSHPVLPPALSLSQHQEIFSNELAFLIRWPKYWSFSISPSSEYSGLISLGIDWFELLAADGLKLRLRECGSPGRQGPWGARPLWIRQTHSSPLSVALFCPHSHLRQLIADMSSLVQYKNKLTSKTHNKNKGNVIREEVITSIMSQYSKQSYKTSVIKFRGKDGVVSRTKKNTAITDLGS